VYIHRSLIFDEEHRPHVHPKLDKQYVRIQSFAQIPLLNRIYSLILIEWLHRQRLKSMNEILSFYYGINLLPHRLNTFHKILSSSLNIYPIIRYVLFSKYYILNVIHKECILFKRAKDNISLIKSDLFLLKGGYNFSKKEIGDG